MRKIHKNRSLGLGLSFLALFSFAACSERPGKVTFDKKGANAGADGSGVDSGDPDAASPVGNGSVKLITQKFRGLSSVEVKNSVLDLYGVSLEPVMADHPAEATDTGFFNSINSFSLTSPLAKWNAQQAAYVASKLSVDAPVFKGLTACAAGNAVCLEANLTKVATQTYRRVPSKAEIDALLASIIKSGAKTYLESMSVAVEIMLQSPQFTFHAEAADVKGVLNGSYAVAARLASMLWQSTPDSILMAAAAKDGLLDEASVKAQVVRMLADPRSVRGLGQFAIEWLRLFELSRRDLTEANAAGLTPGIMKGMILETSRTFTAAAMDPKSDFLEGIFAPKNTFLTSELAKFYGVTVAGATATEPALVSIAADSPRRGLLTQASFMFATSKRSATSVIIRGNIVMETLLCKHAGAPGPDDLAEAAKDAAVKRTKKEESAFRMTKPKCGACHQLFDPIGIALEGFDFLGRPRTIDEVKDPVITTTNFALDGKKTDFADALAVAAAFSKSEEVGRCVAKQMMNYAFAGNLSDPKDEVLDRVSKAFADEGHSFQALVTAIVLTPEFLEP